MSVCMVEDGAKDNFITKFLKFIIFHQTVAG